ncbi:hypothetical protein [Sphingobacterium suaedae]|uniref:DUF5018 domain-containing protein n=1 Tax=Sphingobacterium suaedae TaxID=1686402 RepID=A0ABW5KFQ3_9SPHI
MQLHRTLIKTGLLYALFFTMYSCTKTEDLPPLSEDRVVEYKIVNLPNDEVIYGAIDNEANEITVYLPFYYGLLVIDPEIKLSTGAALRDPIVPINTTSTTTTYTVRAANGSVRTYTLHIILQSTESLQVTWPEGTFPANLSPQRYLPAITGNFAHTNPQIVEVTLINQQTNQRYPLKATSLTPVQDYYSLRTDRIPAEVTKGSYKIEIKNLGHTATMEEPFEIAYEQPDVYFTPSLITMKKTDEWEIVPYSTVFLGLEKVTATVKGQDYELPIKSWNRTQMKITFPADFPTGPLSDVSVHFDFKEWQRVTLIAQLNITES